MEGNVLKKINDVAKALAEVGIAKARNAPDKIGGFAFRGIDDVLAAISGPLVEHGLRILQTAVERTASVVNTKNGTGYNVVVLVTYTFISVDDGSAVTVQAPGEGFDTGDKATSKAISSAFKSMVFTNFAVPTEPTGSLDNESGSDELARQPIAAPAPAAAPSGDAGEKHSAEKATAALVKMLTTAIAQKGDKATALVKARATELGVKKFSDLPKDVASALLKEVRAL